MKPNIDNEKYIGIYNEEESMYKITRKSDNLQGGWIEKESNLSIYGDCWIYGNAKVYGNAEIYGDAKVLNKAEVCGDARVFGDAIVSDNARVSSDAEVYGYAWIFGNAEIKKSDDYVVFKNTTTSRRYFTYIFPQDSWIIGCFTGNTDDLINHLESNGNEEQRKEYKLYIELVKKLKKMKG